jgi:putative transposase
MKEQTLWKTFTYTLNLTPQQQRALDFVLRRCWELYNSALVERRCAWQKSGMSVTMAMQSAQLPDIKEARPEYGNIHSQVLQDVLTRLDKAYQAFFLHVKNGETLGIPRCRAASRYTSITYKQFGNWATLATASWSRPRSVVSWCAGLARWSACPRRSRSAGKRTDTVPASPVRYKKALR